MFGAGPRIDWGRVMALPYFGLVLSALLGFGVAALLRPVCRGDACTLERAPPVSATRNKVFQYGDRCVEFKARPVPCAGRRPVLAVGEEPPA
jgi:hypothetical protein